MATHYSTLPGKSHGWRSLVGCSPWGREESDTTERLHFHFSLSCIGEGNGSPPQCSCLEYPRDGGAWWAAVYGVAQSQTRLSNSQWCEDHLFLILGRQQAVWTAYGMTDSCLWPVKFLENRRVGGAFPFLLGCGLGSVGA